MTTNARRSNRHTRSVLPTLAAASALALAACSGTPSDATSSAPQTSASSDATSASSDGGTVTVWHYFTNTNQVALMDTFADMFEASHPGVTVENVFVPYDQMNTKLVSAAGAKTGPDVALFNGAETAAVALGGALAPLDDYLAGYEFRDQLPDSTLHVIHDKTYAVQGYVNLLGLWYNQDILDEIGVEPPTTIDELESAMQAAKDAGYGGITLTGKPNTQGEWQAYPWLTAEGFTYENLDEAAFAAGLARVRDWVEKGYLTQEAVTWDQTVPFQTFAAGGIAFAVNGNWQIGTAKSDAHFAYGVTALPIGDTGQIYLGGEGQGVGAFAKNPDLAWEYLTSVFLSPEGQLTAAETAGMLPSRLDAAQDSTVSGNPLLVPFAEEVPTYGAVYPSGVIPPEAVADVQLTVGQAWSAVIGGQSSPEDAAATAIAAIKSAIG